MTIQVGHPHECPTFFCPSPQRKSTSQRVNESTSLQVGESTGWCPIGRISPIRPMPPNAKGPCAKICASCSIYQSQFQLDTILQTERTVPLVCFFCLVWVIIKSGVGVAYFKKLSYFCDSFLDDSMLFGLLMNS